MKQIHKFSCVRNSINNHERGVLIDLSNVTNKMGSVCFSAIKSDVYWKLTYSRICQDIWCISKKDSSTNIGFND